MFSFSSTSFTPAMTSVPPPTSTSMSLLALTTPFVFAHGCDNIYATSFVSTVTYTGTDIRAVEGITTSYPVLASGPTQNPQFESCQPSNWSQVATQSRFHFSPAVCPNHWTAYNIAHSYLRAQTPMRIVTRAYCCDEGFEFNEALWLNLSEPVWQVCVRNNQPQFGASPGAMTTLHTAWAVIWEETDIPILSPVPPSLTPGMIISSWVPGSPVVTTSASPTTKKTGSTSSGGRSLGAGYIVIPTIFSIVVVSCLSYYLLQSRRKTTSTRMQGASEATDTAHAREATAEIVLPPYSRATTGPEAGRRPSIETAPPPPYSPREQIS